MTCFLTKETVFRDMESRTVLFNSSVLNYLVCNVECYNANISFVQFSNEKFVIVTCFKKSVLQLKQSLNIYIYVCNIRIIHLLYIYIFFSSSIDLVQVLSYFIVIEWTRYAFSQHLSLNVNFPVLSSVLLFKHIHA